MRKSIFDLVPEGTIREAELALIAGGKKKKKDEEKEERHEIVIPDGGCFVGVCISSIVPGGDCTTGICG